MSEGEGAYVRLWKTLVHSTGDPDKRPLGP